MGLFETIITAILASGVWLFVVAFLGKSLIANWLSKDIEKYKGQVSAQNNERQIILSRVNEKRAEAILKIYLGIVEYSAQAKQFVYQAEHVEESQRELLLDSLSNSSSRFRSVYSQNHLYLDNATCNNIQSVFREVQLPAHRFIYALGAFQGESLTEEQFREEWEKAFVSFADKIPPILENLEGQFRNLLGVES